MIASAEMGRRPVQTREMLPQLERQQIQALLKAGFSVKATAKEASASVDTVRRVRAEDAVTHVDDERHRGSSGVGRPSKTRALEDVVLSGLAEAPDLPTQELLRRAREGGYDGHKIAFTRWSRAFDRATRCLSSASRGYLVSSRSTTSEAAPAAKPSRTAPPPRRASARW